MSHEGLPAEVIAAADAWWAKDFALPASALRPLRTHVQAHAGKLEGVSGIWILSAGTHPLVSLPASVYEHLDRRARDWSAACVTDADALRRAILPFEATKIIGPAFIGYGTRPLLDLSASALARPVTGSDEGALEALRAECTAEEWEHGGCEAPVPERFAAFDPEDGCACSLASYERWDQLAHVSIVTKMSARGRGFARAAAALASSHALDAGLIPQYRTLRSNLPSMRLGSHLGFREYGFSVYVRLRALQA